MIQEYFWKHEKKPSFNLEIICLANKGFLKMQLTYMIDGNGTETHIKSFDMIHPNTDAGVSMGTLLTGTTCGYRKK